MSRDERITQVLYDWFYPDLSENECDKVVAQLTGVIEDAEAKAWERGKFSEHTPDCRMNDGDAGSFGDCICPNPYRLESTR